MCLIDKLQRVQNAAARLVTCIRIRKFDNSRTPILKKLQWFPVKQRIFYKILLLTFKAQNGIAPQYISELLTPYKPAKTFRSSNRNYFFKFHATALKPMATDRSKLLRPLILWNSLPLMTKKSISVNNFKSSVKTFLYKQAFG